MNRDDICVTGMIFAEDWIDGGAVGYLQYIYRWKN